MYRGSPCRSYVKLMIRNEANKRNVINYEVPEAETKAMPKCQNAKKQSKFYKSSTVANIAEWGRKIWQTCHKWKKKSRIRKRNIIVEKRISILDYLLKIFSKIERFIVIRTGSRRKNEKTRSVSLLVWNDNYCLTTPCWFISPGVGTTVVW